MRKRKKWVSGVSGPSCGVVRVVQGWRQTDERRGSEERFGDVGQRRTRRGSFRVVECGVRCKGRSATGRTAARVLSSLSRTEAASPGRRRRCKSWMGERVVPAVPLVEPDERLRAGGVGGAKRDRSARALWLGSAMAGSEGVAIGLVVRAKSSEISRD